MKKILYVLLTVLLMTGCTDLSNTPTKRVEEFLKNYQSLDSNVLNDLDIAISNQHNFSTQQADIYRGIMKKHYQNN